MDEELEFPAPKTTIAFDGPKEIAAAEARGRKQMAEEVRVELAHLYEASKGTSFERAFEIALQIPEMKLAEGKEK